jgi:DNA-binding transcriptional LysR family regulator
MTRRQRPNLTLTQAQYFLALAEYRHFTVAGQRLGVSQQTISASIRAMEKAVGTVLFKRTPRAVDMTEQGALLLPFVRALVESAERLDLEAENLSGRAPQAIRIAYTETAGHEVVPAVLDALGDKWPDLDVQAREVWASELAAQVHERRADIGFGRCLTGEDALLIAAVRADRLALVIPAGHRLAARPSVTIAELEGERLVMFPRHLAPGLHDAILRTVDDAGVEMHVVASQMLGAGGLPARLRAVGGVEICARSRLRHPVDGLVMIPIDSPSILTVDVAWTPRPSEASQRIVTFIRTLGQANGWLDPETVIASR